MIEVNVGRCTAESPAVQTSEGVLGEEAKGCCALSKKVAGVAHVRESREVASNSVLMIFVTVVRSTSSAEEGRWVER